MPGGVGESTSLVSKPLQDALQGRIDELGFGGFQLLALACTGGVLMSEGSEMLIMGSITQMLDKEWHLGNFTRGFMVSVVFIGFALGNLLSGAIGDHHGRRPTIMLSYFVIGFAGFLTSQAQSALAMVCLRFVVGLGCGVGFPSVYTLVPEICPTKWRGATCALMIGFMPFGELFASLGVILIDKDLEGLRALKADLPLPGDSWRRLCQYSALPPFLFFGACLSFLKESPFFLAERGRWEELDTTLEAMAFWSGKPHRPLDAAALVSGGATGGAGDDDVDDAKAVAAASAFSWSRALERCLSERFLATTLVMFCAHFTKDFSVFGLNYVFPQYFREMSSPMSVGWQMFFISLIALPGVLVAVAVTRSKCIGNIASLSSLAFACGALAFGLLTESPMYMHCVCAPLVKVMALAYFIITVVYTAEVFPTSVRNSAVGLCTSAGRLGSISAPLAFELSTGFDFFWCTLAFCMWTVAVLARLFLTIETKGRPLSDGDPPSHAVAGEGHEIARGAAGYRTMAGAWAKEKV